MAERLAAPGQHHMRDLFHGLDVTDPCNLLNYMKRVYAKRGRTLTRRRSLVKLT